MTVEKGLKTYHDQLPNLLPEHEGKWVLINDDHVQVFDSQEEANRVGFETFGKINDFYVCRIERERFSDEGSEEAV